MLDRLQILHHQQLLEVEGLTSVEAVISFKGEQVKSHRGNRDVLRIPSRPGTPELFIKRYLRPYPKSILESIWDRKPLSIAEREAENLLRLEALGIPAVGCVAVGARAGRSGDIFSFIITEGATGQSLLDWLRSRPHAALLRRVSQDVAGLVKKAHDGGLGLPTLMARHIFVQFDENPQPRLCLIDVDRLTTPIGLERLKWQNRRARDLAGLNISMPLRHLSHRDRLRFLRRYTGGRIDRELLRAIVRRTRYLLRNRRLLAGDFLDRAPHTALAMWVEPRFPWPASSSRLLRTAALLGIGMALLWLGYKLTHHGLIDEALDLTDEIQHVAHSYDWLFSPISLIGVMLVALSLLSFVFGTRRR